MSGKRPSLAESLRQSVAVDPPPIAAPVPATPTAVHVEAPQATPRSAGFYAATRVGKKKVTAALNPTMHKQLKGLAVEHDVTTEALIIEAINDLFRKYGKSLA